MISKIASIIPSGFNAAEIVVEGDTSNGLPAFNIVGMGSRTINEARERVRAAIRSSGFAFPDQKLTINLAPAELSKDGTYLDLPIALSVLVLSGQLREEDVAGKVFVGELSLDGELRPIRGIINIVERARELNAPEVYLPSANLPQASLIQGVKLIGVKTLRELFSHLKGQKLIRPTDTNASTSANATAGANAAATPNFAPEDAPSSSSLAASNSPIYDHIRGQSVPKRALAIAMAGRHNILISGPPGTGKTMLAKSALNLLPPLSGSEQISITKLYSIAGLTDSIMTARPFRTPHHTASPVSIIGGGNKALPGEISLAHLGVLFLDELPEYPRNTLEALRQPLEDRQISVSRANSKTTYPADFMLIATMNPCPCGYLGDPAHECTCTLQQIKAYQKKLSGPLMDRIDLFVTASRIDNKELTKEPEITGEHTAVKNTITAAISRQRARYGNSTTFNSALSSHAVATSLRLDSAAKRLLESASDSLSLSARAYFRVIKVARTIADLDNSDLIKQPHIAEALTYRQP